MGLAGMSKLMGETSLEAEPGAKCISDCTGCLDDAGAVFPCSHCSTLFPTSYPQLQDQSSIGCMVGL